MVRKNMLMLLLSQIQHKKLGRNDILHDCPTVRITEVKFQYISHDFFEQASRIRCGFNGSHYEYKEYFCLFFIWCKPDNPIKQMKFNYINQELLGSVSVENFHSLQFYVYAHVNTSSKLPKL